MNRQGQVATCPFLCVPSDLRGSMISKILVPLDGSKLAEQVLPYARLLAEAFGAEVELLRVTDPDARPPFVGQPSGDYLKMAALRCLPGVSYFCVESTGSPAQTIIEASRKADLIAMATHGTSGLRRWLLGSVASKVAQSATLPLLLVRPLEGASSSLMAPLKTVFVPLDGSPLAEKVLPQVIPIAKKLALQVHLLRVYAPPLSAYVAADGMIVPGAVDFQNPLKEEAQSYLDAKVAELQAEGLERVVATALEGDAADEIIELALKTSDNLIAMTTHGRSGLGRWVMGSVAEKIVQHSRDPVLLVRPL